MARPAPVRPILDDRLQEMLGLIKGADSVEPRSRCPSPTSARPSTPRNGPLDAQVRQVFFFDTPDLALDGAGVVVRARRVQGKGDDTVVKLRPVVPDELAGEAAGVGDVRGRGGRDARGLGLLGIAQGGPRSAMRSRRRWPASAPAQAVQQGAARCSRSTPKGVTPADLAVFGPIRSSS